MIDFLKNFYDDFLYRIKPIHINQDWLDADKYFQMIKDSDNPMDSERWIKIVEHRRKYIKGCLQIFSKNFNELWI